MSLKKNNYIFFKPIQSKRIGIRELEITDSLDIYELFRNNNVTKNLAIDTFKSENNAIDLINRAINQYKNQDIFYLGINTNIDNRIIGYIGLSRFDLTIDTCQVVYSLNEDYWGMGIMVEALKLFIDYLVNIQNKKKIIATHIVRNVNSGKVMIKSGMSRDELLDREMVIRNKIEKLIGYSIIKE